MNTRTRQRGGFTLVEILVVVTIVVILISVAVPAFRSMLYSQEETAAQSQLQAGLSAARDAAIRSGSGADAAAVFTFEPGGRLTIVPCIKVGQFEDHFGGNNNSPISREVFVPVDGVKAVELPSTWSVRAHVPANTIDSEWYEPINGQYRYPLGQSGWVFPETGFYYRNLLGLANNDTGAYRQSFMVRFAGGSGNLVVGETYPVAVVLPRPSASGRDQTPWSLYRLDTSEDLRRTTASILSKPFMVSNTESSQQTADHRRRLLGASSPQVRSSDTVLARSVGEVCLYDESKLAAALGVDVDRVTHTVYHIDGQVWANQGQQTNQIVRPALIEEIAADPFVARRINRWVEGFANLNDPSRLERAETTSAKLFTVDRFLGSLRSIAVPTANQGVN